MSEAMWIAVIGAGIPALVAAVGAAWKIAREQGRAAEYRRNATATIEQKNAEMTELRRAHRDDLADLTSQLNECRDACAFLRRRLETRS